VSAWDEFDTADGYAVPSCLLDALGDLVDADCRAALAQARADLRAARERIAELEGLLAMRGEA
jgi:hypothetical protein